ATLATEAFCWAAAAAGCSPRAWAPSPAASGGLWNSTPGGATGMMSAGGEHPTAYAIARDPTTNPALILSLMVGLPPTPDGAPANRNGVQSARPGGGEGRFVHYGVKTTPSASPGLPAVASVDRPDRRDYADHRDGDPAAEADVDVARGEPGPR